MPGIFDSASKSSMFGDAKKYNHSQSSSVVDELEEQIKNEKNPAIKEYLQEKKKARDEKIKQEYMDLSSKAQEAGLVDEYGLPDVKTYSEKVSKGEIDPLALELKKQREEEAKNSVGGIWGAFINMVTPKEHTWYNPTGIGSPTGRPMDEWAQEDAQAAQEKDQIAAEYSKTDMLYANTNDPVEKARLAERKAQLEGDYASRENAEQSANRTLFGILPSAKALAQHPIDATTDIFVESAKDTVADVWKGAKGRYIEKFQFEPLLQETESLQKEILAEQNPERKQVLMAKADELRQRLDEVANTIPEQDKNTGQLLAQASMGLLEVVTLGAGKKLLQGLATKGGGKILGKAAQETLEEVTGKAITKEAIEKAAKKSLSERIVDIAARSKTRDEFVKKIAKEAGKSTLKLVTNKNTAEAVVMGAGFGAGSAVKEGSTDLEEITKSAALGAGIGWALERGITGAVRGAQRAIPAAKSVAESVAERRAAAQNAKEATGDFKVSKSGEVKLSAMEKVKATGQGVIDALTSGKLTPEEIKAYVEGRETAASNEVKGTFTTRKATEGADTSVEIPDELKANKNKATALQAKVDELRNKENVSETKLLEAPKVEVPADKPVSQMTEPELRAVQAAIQKQHAGSRRMPSADFSRLKLVSTRLQKITDTSNVFKAVDKKIAQGKYHEAVTQIKKNNERYVEAVQRAGLSKEEAQAIVDKKAEALAKKETLTTKEEVLSFKDRIEKMNKAELKEAQRKIDSQPTLDKESLGLLRRVNERLHKMNENTPVKAESTKIRTKTPKKVEKRPLLAELVEKKRTEKSSTLQRIHEEVKTTVEKMKGTPDPQKKLKYAKHVLELSKAHKTVVDLGDDVAKWSEDDYNSVQNAIADAATSEYLLQADGTIVRNLMDLSMVRNASTEGMKPYSLSQLAVDARTLMAKSAEKLRGGRKMEFRQGDKHVTLSGALGEAKHESGIAAALKDADFYTDTHEWAHLITDEKSSFHLTETSDNISALAKKEVGDFFAQATGKRNFREAVANAISMMAASPEVAMQYFPRFATEIMDKAPKEFAEAIIDMNKGWERIRKLDPMTAAQSLQEKTIVPEKKETRRGKLLKTVMTISEQFYSPATLVKYGFSYENITKMQSALFDGVPNIFEESYGSGMVRATKLKAYNLPADFKTREELFKEFSAKYRKGRAGKETELVDKMMGEVGNYKLAQTALERDTLVGLATTKAEEIRIAKEIVRNSDPVIKEYGAGVDKWFKDVKGSLIDNFKDVITPSQMAVLKQLSPSWEHYAPLMRQGRMSKVFAHSEGSAASVYPVMNAYTMKVNDMLSYFNRMKALSKFYKMSLEHMDKGGEIVVEDITRQTTKEKMAEIQKFFDETFDKSEEEMVAAMKQNPEKVKEMMNTLKDYGVYNPNLAPGEVYTVIDGAPKLIKTNPDLAAMFSQKGNSTMDLIMAPLFNKSAMSDAITRYSRVHYGNDITGRGRAKVIYALAALPKYATKLARFGILTSLKFITNNVARDFLTGILRHDRSATGFIRAYTKDTLLRSLRFGSFGAFKKTDWAQKLSMADMIYDMGNIRRSTEFGSYMEKDKISSSYSDKWLSNSSLKGKIARGKDAIEKAFEISESRARKSVIFEELTRLQKEGVKLETMEMDKLADIISRAKRVSIQWEAGGAWSKAMNFSPFGRATMTATSQELVYMLYNPKKFLLRTMATAVAPTLGLWAFNNSSKERQDIWNDLTDQQKQTYWFAILDKDHIIKIAKPKDYGNALAHTMSRTFDNIKAVDPESGYYLSTALYESIWRQNGAFSGVGDVASAAGVDAFNPATFNPLTQSIIETATNKRAYWGTDVVSPYLAKQDKTMQFTDTTSSIAKKLGYATGQSPLVIDNWFANLGGSQGQQLTSATSERKKNTKVNFFGQEISQGTKQVIVPDDIVSIEKPTGGKTAAVKKFYQEFDKIQSMYNGKDNYSFSDKIYVKRYFNAYNDVKESISSDFETIRNVQANKSLSQAQKDEQINRANARMEATVKRFQQSKVHNEFLKSNLKIQQ